MEPAAEQQTEGGATSGASEPQQGDRDDEWLPQAEQAGNGGSSSEQQAAGSEGAEADEQQPEAPSPAAAQESSEFVRKLKSFFQGRSVAYPVRRLPPLPIRAPGHVRHASMLHVYAVCLLHCTQDPSSHLRSSRQRQR